MPWIGDAPAVELVIITIRTDRLPLDCTTALVTTPTTRGADNHRSETPLLIFLHLPKAAGLTFNTVLERQYPSRTVFRTAAHDWRGSIAELRDKPEEEKRALRVVLGHMGFGVHELFPQSANYVTIVREPVARIVSHYHFVLRLRNHYLHDEVVGRRMSLLDYACSGLTHELDNGQTRLLAGPDDVLVEPTTQTLELAKSHIRDRFLLAGLTERFDETVLLLRSLLGWGSVTYARINVTPAHDRRPLTQDTIDAIRERNRFDAELYRFSEALFAERVAASGVPFQHELRLLRRRNAAYSAVMTPARHARRRLRAAFS